MQVKKLILYIFHFMFPRTVFSTSWELINYFLLKLFYFCENLYQENSKPLLYSVLVTVHENCSKNRGVRTFDVLLSKYKKQAFCSFQDFK